MPTSPTTRASATVPRLGPLDTARVLLGVVAPTLAQGVIARRPRVVALAQRLDTDRRAVATMRRLARRHGPGPALLGLPGRSVALVLDPDDVHRVLEGSPEPFALANREKQEALGQFQPHGVLVSHGVQREQRRAFVEDVLDTPRPVHRLGTAVTGPVAQEAAAVADEAARTGRLAWDDVALGWRRAVRRVVLGDGARDDTAVHDDLDALRYRANWSFLLPRARRTRERLRERLRTHLDRAEPGSLAAIVAGRPAADGVDPVDQVPQWLFAADPALMAAYRALALLVADPEEARRVREEIAGTAPDQERPRLRAVVLESVRLWATTPMVLRDTTAVTTWRGRELPAGSAVAVYAPFFHRDGDALAWADRFRPANWLAEGGHASWPLIPFSEGPGVCPGQNLVLLMTSTFVAELLVRLEPAIVEPAGLDVTALPGVLDPFGLRFSAVSRPG